MHTFTNSIIDRLDYVEFYLNLSRKDCDIVPYMSRSLTGYLVNTPELVESVFDRRADFVGTTHPYRSIISQLCDPGKLLLRAAPASTGREAQFNRVLAASSAAVTGFISPLRDTPSPTTSLNIGHESKILCLQLISQLLFDHTIDSMTGDFVLATNFIEEYYINYGAQPVDSLPLSLQQDIMSARAITARVAVDIQSTTAPDIEVTASSSHGIIETLLNGYVALAAGFAWTLYMLALSPMDQHKVRVEFQAGRPEVLGQPKNILRLHHLRCVIRESLRLYPPAWLIGRRSTQDVMLGHTPIPAGSHLILSPYTIHRNPVLWNDPDRFYPLRFSRPVHHRYSYFPYGGGESMCPATPFIESLLATMVANFVSMYSFTCDTAVRPRGLISLRPSPDIFLGITPLD